MNELKPLSVLPEWWDEEWINAPPMVPMDDDAYPAYSLCKGDYCWVAGLISENV